MINKNSQNTEKKLNLLYEKCFKKKKINNFSVAKIKSSLLKQL